MDPEATLQRLREIRAEIQAAAADGMSDDHAVDLLIESCDLFEALDNWISRGGYMPREWGRAYLGQV